MQLLKSNNFAEIFIEVANKGDSVVNAVVVVFILQCTWFSIYKVYVRTFF